MPRRKGYAIIIMVCFFYWILDSIWSYLSFEYNLKNLIFSEPGSYLDTFLLKVPPYQIVSRIMVVCLFAIIGTIIIEFIKRHQESEKRHVIEQKKTNQYLLKAQKMESIGNLAGGIAHDFNNLLFPIIGMSELLLDDFPEDSPEHESIKEILKAGKRGRDLVRQILSFSRQSEEQKIPVRIQQVLEEVLKLSRATIPSDIDISQDIQKDCGMIMGDPTQLHQVAMNLMTNAYHAVAQPGGQIHVELKEICFDENTPAKGLAPEFRYVLLKITDNGCGIEPHIQDKIFDPYFSTKETGKGTGLGLAMVYGIIQTHKGDIAVDSQPGKGSSFFIYLPVIDELPEMDTEDIGESLSGGSEHILIVDDEAIIVSLEHQMLSRLGYKISSHTSSLEALACFQKSPDDFDLVITDIAMPDIPGDVLAEKCLSLRPDIPIIVCTGFSDRIDPEKAKKSGIKGFLMKPLVQSEIARMVRRVLDGNS